MKSRPPTRRRVVALAALLVVLALTPAARTPGPAGGNLPPAARAAAPAGGGNGAFLAAQADLAKKALRSRDYYAAHAAWLAVLEFDPVNLAALEGLVEVAGKSKDADAEALYRLELNRTYAAAAQAGDKKAERALEKSLERQALLEPFAGEAAELVARHSAAMAELGAGYLEKGFHGMALTCWTERSMSVPAGSAEAAEARDAITRCLAEGDDYVAGLNVAPDLGDGGRDQAWIADFDKKTEKFSKAGEWETPHYRIKVAGNWRLGETTARVMEQVAVFYRDVWGLQPDPPPAKPDPTRRDVNITPIALNIYLTKEEYLKRTGSPDWSGGVFMGSEVALWDYENSGQSWRATLPTLFHEASHQFMSEAVGGVPSFVNEGIACQFESIEILPNGTIRRDAPNKQYLQDLVKQIKTDPTFSLGYVMDAKNGNEPKFYAPRWGLFHFLRMYVDDQGGYLYRDALEDYIYSFKRGTPGNAEEHFEEHLVQPLAVPGIASFADFERVWRQWILDLDASLKGRDKRLEQYRSQARMAGLRGEHQTARAFFEKIFDLEPDDPEMLVGLATAAEHTGQPDRAVWMLRRWLAISEPDAPDRSTHAATMTRLDPFSQERASARNELVGGMAGLAQRYDREALPLMAMRVAHDVLEIDPYDPSSRALVARLERETGRSVIRWQRLFNGIDLQGWVGAGSSAAFHVRDGELVADYSRVVDPNNNTEEAGVSLYQTLFVDRNMAGDWSIEMQVNTSADWELAGLCFGARDADHFEAIVLRRGNDGMNRVDFGSFDGIWSFRGDGSYKASYDPTAAAGTRLRVDVRDREVSVTIDGTPLKPVVGGVERGSIKYPMTALRGDAGLLASKGVTRYSDLRLLAGRAR